MPKRKCPICGAACESAGHHASTDPETGYREDAELYRCPAHGPFDAEDSVPDTAECVCCGKNDDTADMELVRDGWAHCACYDHEPPPPPEFDAHWEDGYV